MKISASSLTAAFSLQLPSPSKSTRHPAVSQSIWCCNTVGLLWPHFPRCICGCGLYEGADGLRKPWYWLAMGWCEVSSAWQWSVSEHHTSLTSSLLFYPHHKNQSPIFSGIAHAVQRRIFYHTCLFGTQMYSLCVCKPFPFYSAFTLITLFSPISSTPPERKWSRIIILPFFVATNSPTSLLLTSVSMQRKQSFSKDQSHWVGLLSPAWIDTARFMSLCNTHAQKHTRAHTLMEEKQFKDIPMRAGPPFLELTYRPIGWLAHQGIQKFIMTGSPVLKVCFSPLLQSAALTLSDLPKSP